jgi:hypothetical protein
MFGGESALGVASRVLEVPSKVLGVTPTGVEGVEEAVVEVASPPEVLEIELEVLGDIPRGVVGVGEVLEGVGSPPKLVADSSAATAASTRYSMVKSEFHPMLPSSSYNQLQPRSSSNITLRAVRTRCVAGSNTRSALTPSS